jgi:hypothetical protein
MSELRISYFHVGVWLMGWQYNQGLMDHQEYMLYNNPVVVRNKETFINYY